MSNVYCEIIFLKPGLQIECLGWLKCDGVEGQVINMPWRIKNAFTNSFVHDKNIYIILIMGLLSTKDTQQTNLWAIPKEMKSSLPPLYVFFF